MLRHVSTQCLFVSAGILVWGLGARAEVVIETVTVGNAGNAGENSGESDPDGWGPDRICGPVDYVYNIGTFEVTAGQYTEFLNAVAAADPYGLWNPSMDSNSAPQGCQITQHGSSGSYTYDFSGRPSGTEADWLDRPVNYVSWGDAARFCNWLHNGQPTGAQNLSTTEDGSYFLDGAESHAELLDIEREPDATWVIPSEDEWYKAAYHKNDGVTGNYFDYPTSSDSVPSNDLVDPDPGNNATFKDSNGYYTIGSPYWKTEVGAHENSGSPYGTFDQGGNVWEWNEAIVFGPSGQHGPDRGVRGSTWYSSTGFMHAAHRSYDGHPDREGSGYGFRVADVSESNCAHDGDGDGDVDLCDFALYQATFADARCYALFHMAFNGPQ